MNGPTYKIAKAIFKADEPRWRTDKGVPSFESLSVTVKRRFLAQARAAMEAIQVTDAMVEALLDTRYAGTDWRAIIIELDNFTNTKVAAKCELIAALAAFRKGAE